VIKNLTTAVAGLCVIAATLVVSGAIGIGVAPAADSALGCTDIWTGGAGTTDWSAAGNWSTGVVPNAAGVDACIPGGTTVVDLHTAITLGELTVAKGSSLTVGSAGGPATESAGATLSVSSGLENDGTLTAGRSDSGTPTLALDGPVTNTGTFELFGTLTLGGAAASSFSNTGTLGIAPGGVVDLEKASLLTNAPTGLLALGIDGPPTSASAYGRIMNGSLALDGSVAPVFEGGFTPSPAAEYEVATSAYTGKFATLRNDATADYSRPDAVGLIGGLPAIPTAIDMTSTATTPVFGQGVRFTAAVTHAWGPAPTGSVSFSAGGVLLGTTPVSATDGVTTATFDTAALPVGSQTVTATYDGDVLFGPSTTTPADELTVEPDNSSVALAAAPANAAPGEQVTYTVSVSAAPPGAGQADGTVSLSDDGTPLTGCQSLTLPSTDPQHVTCSTTYAADATHSVVATYNGSADFLPSRSSLTETVAPRPTTTSMTVSPRTSTTGEPVSFTATVASGPGTANPTGSVTFTDDGTAIGVSTLTTTDGVTTTSLLLTTLPLGVNAIRATFGGDADFGSSVSAATPVTVSGATTALSLVSSDGLTSAGHPVTFIANVFPETGSDETGTVTFFYNGSLIGTAGVSNGQAMLTTATLPIGTGSATATYAGDANFAGSATTTAWSQEVDAPPG
jgi:hypothetical protein